MDTIVDDNGKSVESGTVLYDFQIGEFVRLKRDGDTVQEIDVCYTFSIEDCLASDY